MGSVYFSLSGAGVTLVDPTSSGRTESVMEIQEADLIHVWRTNGGLYVNENGRTGKPCALRRSPYGINVSGPNLSAHYEVVYTRYGKRHRFIHPSEVRPGTSLRIETLRNGWVQTGLCQIL